MAVEDIQALARKCARSGLKYRDARALFDALYRADALMLCGGSMCRAADIAGVNPPALYRQRAKDEMKRRKMLAEMAEDDQKNGLI